MPCKNYYGEESGIVTQLMEWYGEDLKIFSMQRAAASQPG